MLKHQSGAGPRPAAASQAASPIFRSLTATLIIATAVFVLYLPPSHAQNATAPTKAKAATKAKSATQSPAAQAKTEKALVDTYCVTCHNNSDRTGDVSFESVSFEDVPKSAELWEKAIRKIRVGAMPPQGMPRPDKAALDGLATYLETSLDRSASAHPNPGHATMHRLNRAEYANAVRDLLALDIDSTALLPPDDESAGFDNIADVLKVSPSLMERYLSASWNISRTAVGNPAIAPSTDVYRARPDLSQDQHIEGLPLGTKGGMLVKHTFPLDGEYTIKLRLWRNTFDLIRGIEDPHTIELALDGKQIKVATAGGHDEWVDMAGNPGVYGANLDQKLTVTLHVPAGVHTITAATFARSHSEKDDLIKPFMRTTIDGLDITGDPSVDRITIEGPFKQTGRGDSASRRKIFTCHPAKSEDEVPCARTILSTLARHAYRRPVKDNDLETLLSFYQRRRNEKGSFDDGIESALQFVLAAPEFLFRFEQDPKGVAPGSAYQVDDLALASRLSFFLWSSIPDDQLINIATQGKLKDPIVLQQQIKRMLADPKSDALIDNFAEQWLFLRNIKSSAPNMENFPDFDDNLRQAMRTETKMFFNSILREDRNVMDLMNADYTFVNERLARHYNIPGIYGDQFRRVKITDENRRGLLGQASILTVTSYAARTSPVQRGKWVLTNILGVPPTPPPPNVPELKENGEGSKPLPLRARMEQHRAMEPCAGCHRNMDPVGFALENFDAIGHWRTVDDGAPINPSGTLFNGAKVDGPAGLRQMIASRPDVFVGVVAEKMMTYALGRGTEYFDMPSVRKVVAGSRANNYKFSTLVAGIVKSTPFEMRTARKAAE